MIQGTPSDDRFNGELDLPPASTPRPDYTHRLLHYIDEYLSDRDLNMRSAILGQVERFPLAESLVVAGEMCVELARDKPKEATEFLVRAGRNFERVLNDSSHSSAHLDAESLRAQRMLNMMPFFFSMFVDMKLPDQSWQTKVYEKNLSNAARAVISLEHADFSGKYTSIDMATLIVGEVAEQAAGLLGNRFGISLGDTGWVMVPSLFSEDRDRIYRSGHRQKKWDYSVFGSIMGTDIPAYKLQVKNSIRASKAGSGYKDDIKVLHVREDLAIRPRKTTTASAIIQECVREQATTKTDITRRLNARTELLLDILD